jgi:hypothetical protein
MTPYTVGPLDFPPGTRYGGLNCNSLSQQEKEPLRIDNALWSTRTFRRGVPHMPDHGFRCFGR